VPIKLLGYYSNFPTNIHGIARYNYQTSTQKLQKAIVHVFYQLNRETHDLKTVTRSSPANCRLSFELGVAEQDAFNFLEKEELEKFLRRIEEVKEPLRILDFFCVTRYHTTNSNGKRKPLRFDYALLRYAFYRRTMELFIVHERGTQRIPLEDLATFLTKRINDELSRKGIKTLTLKHMRTL